MRRRRPRVERRWRVRASSRTHQASDLAVCVALLLGVPLVVLLFAFAECHRPLRDAAFEVELERNQCEPLALDRTYQTPDLPLVQQQLASPGGLVIVVARALVGRDVQVQYIDLAVAHDAIRV